MCLFWIWMMNVDVCCHFMPTFDIDLSFFMCERVDCCSGEWGEPTIDCSWANVYLHISVCVFLHIFVYLSCSIFIFTSISVLLVLQGLGTSWQIIRDPGNQSKYLSKNQPKLSFLQNFEIWFWKTFNLPFNLSPSQFELLVSLNYCTLLSFLPFSVPGAKSLFLVARPYVIICLQPVP